MRDAMSGPIDGWAVVHTHGGRRQAEIAVLITGVPRGMTRASITAVLEGWTRWRALQGRLGAGDRLVVRKLSGVPRYSGLDDSNAITITWEALAPVVRVLSLRIPSDDLEAMRRTAIMCGESLQVWALRSLRAFAGVDEVDA